MPTSRLSSGSGSKGADGADSDCGFAGAMAAKDFSRLKLGTAGLVSASFGWIAGIQGEISVAPS